MKNAVYIFLLLAFTAHADDTGYTSARAAMVVEVEYYAMLARDADDFVERYKFHISPAPRISAGISPSSCCPGPSSSLPAR